VTRAERALKVGYFAYFAAIGVFQPYWPVALAANGYAPASIGVLMAAVSGVRIVAPLAQERYAAWLGDRARALGLTATLAALLVPLLAMTHGLAPALAGIMVFSLCINGLMPVYDAVAVDLLAGDGHRYGRVRLWGSIGYIVASFAVGALVARAGPGSIPVALCVLLLCTALVCRWLPAQRVVARPRARAASAPPGSRAWRWLLVVCFLQLASFGGYYSFYSLYLQHYGYSGPAIGVYWSLGVLAEITVFYAAAPLVRALPLVVLLEVAIAGTVLRWLLIALCPEQPLVLGAAQLLHLCGFGLFHTVCVLLAPRLIAVGSARALAIVSSVGWGAGGVAGSLLAGRLWQTLGPQSVYYASAVLAAAALLAAEFGLRRASRAPVPAA
jgi:PPP family 3-phenylpropionic acid transporter